MIRNLDATSPAPIVDDRLSAARSVQALDDQRQQRAMARLRAAVRRRGLIIALAGIDGSGKTTLARKLAATFEQAGVPVERRHLYAWYVNLAWTPLVMLAARRKPRVLILDRGIYDNLAKWEVSAPILKPLLRGLVWCLRRMYPRPDIALHLRADWTQTAARRPEMLRDRYLRLTRAYHQVMAAAGFRRLRSDDETERTARRHIDAACEATQSQQRVIFHADDLGLTHSFNEGIRHAHQHGLLTSTSLRVNGAAYRHAITEVLPACPQLGVGLHVCLNEAACIAPAEQVPLLLGPDGRQKPGFAWLLRLAATPAGRDQIEIELRAQIERAQADGVIIGHLDSHQHVHMIPAIFHIVCRLACEYGIDRVRMTREPRHVAGRGRRRWQPLTNANWIKHLLLNHFARRNAAVAEAFGLRTTDWFVGVNYTGCMDEASVTAGLEAATRRNGATVEVLLHPTTGHDPRDEKYPAEYLKAYVAAPERMTELNALTSTRLAQTLRRQGWATARYGDALPTTQRPRPVAREAAIDPALHELCTSMAADNPLWVSTAQADARAFAEVALSQLRPGDRLLDLGTGSGILALCAAKLGYTVTATDVSRGAVQTARQNAALAGLPFDCLESDLLQAVTGRFDAIALNLPYNFRPDSFISNVVKNLARRIPWVCQHSGTMIPLGVQRFHNALMTRLLSQVNDHLNPGGWLLLHVFDFEVGVFARMLPPAARVEILRHPQFSAHRTVAMLVRMPHSHA